jgi:hypothetical protein
MLQVVLAALVLSLVLAPLLVAIQLTDRAAPLPPANG